MAPYPKGYCGPGAVATYLGTALNDVQTAAATALLPIAEQVVDALARASWLDGPIVAEQYDLGNLGPKITLRSRPVASIQTIQTRTYVPGDTLQTLVAGTDYELVNPAAGLLVLSASYGSSASYSGYHDYGGSLSYNESGTLLRAGRSFGSFALVSYTPVQAVPGPVAQATAMLTAHWLTYQFNPGLYGLTSERTADQALAVDAMVVHGEIPTGVLHLLDKTVARLIL